MPCCMVAAEVTMRCADVLRSALVILAAAVPVAAQAPPPSSAPPARVEITPAKAQGEVGQTMSFAAAAYDESGKRLDLKATAWFASPFDSAAPTDQNGSVTFFLPGEIRVGAIIGGKPAFAVVTV